MTHCEQCGAVIIGPVYPRDIYREGRYKQRMYLCKECADGWDKATGFTVAVGVGAALLGLLSFL